MNNLIRKLKKFYAFFRYPNSVRGNRRFRALEAAFQRALRQFWGQDRFQHCSAINSAMRVVLEARERRYNKRLKV